MAMQYLSEKILEAVSKTFRSTGGMEDYAAAATILDTFQKTIIARINA